jgi:hypothetical protein
VFNVCLLLLGLRIIDNVFGGGFIQGRVPNFSQPREERSQAWSLRSHCGQSNAGWNAEALTRGTDQEEPAADGRCAG